MDLKSWLKQPSTVTGMAGLATTIVWAIAHVTTHDTTIAIAAAGVAGSAVAIALPDNSAAKSSVEKLVTDAVQATVQHRVAAAIPTLAADALAAVQAMTQPAPAPAPAVAVAVAQQAPPAA